MACSTRTRLVSAERSWGITVEGRGRVLLQYRDGRDVGQGLADQEIGFAECAGASAEQAECAHDGACGAHRNGVHGGEAGVARGGDEPRPAVGFGRRGRPPRPARR